MCLTAAVAAGWASLASRASQASHTAQHRNAAPQRSAGTHAVKTLRVVVMGVSGCGKSALAKRLARAVGGEFVEGDELHSVRNVELMAAGIALTDDDRQGWLQTIADRLRQAQQQERSIVVSCSALKRRYRDLLRQGAADTRFIHLHGSAKVLAQRLARRAGHYMPASLLPSQLQALEAPGPDENALTFDIETPLETVVKAALKGLTTTTVATVATSTTLTTLVTPTASTDAST